MFRHRLSKFGIMSLLSAFMLLVGGSLQSCQDMLDVYPYDDPGDPEWLGASVYDFLKDGTAEHKYTNFVALIDSLGEKESLAHTGSKTIFVADDEAFERFYANNPWGVKSVADMTTAQRKVLLYNAMLDNAMLLEMLSSTGVQTNQEGTCLRRWNSSRIIDTIPLVNGSSMEHHENWPAYNKYWNALRGEDRTETLRLAMDGSRAMMVHFIGDYLRKNNILASDIQFLYTKNGEVQKTYADGDAFIFGNKLMPSGVDAGTFSDDSLTITCKNGYVYRLDDVLLQPSNMADELRKRKDTRIFSYLLDRFCIPVYDDALTREYNAFYKTAKSDSVFRLRYLNKEYASNSLLAAQNSNPTNEELLNFDPGNNSTGAQMLGDMSAMFVPKDEALFEYFANPDSAGNFLLVRYAPNVQVTDINSLMQALDSVPEKNISPFLNNLMKASFSKSVVSKFDKLVDDANELMNITPAHVDECVVANNGVIYILNSVFGPAAYEAVSAPTLVNENMNIMRNIISQLRYDYYLLAMDADYSLIVPDDRHFVYYDPISTKSWMTNPSPKAYSFHYDTKMPKANGALKLWSEEYGFKVDSRELTDSVGKAPKEYSISGTNFGGGFMSNRMTDLMEYLIIIHDDDLGIMSGNKYFQTKGYGTIKVDATDVNNIKFYGGEQLELGTYVKVSNYSNQKNGKTYMTVPANEDTEKFKFSAIPTPPTKSVYDNMSAYAKEEHDRFYEFFKLCYEGEDFVKNGGLLSSVFNIKNSDDLLDSAMVYSIFFTDTESSGAITRNTVPFFNIYHYTVYVPSNESVKEMRKLGLPTWEQVHLADSLGAKAKAASMLRQINLFAKYHFQDNSVYIDNTTLLSENGYTTAVLNETTGRFYELELGTEGNTIVVVDDMGNKRKVMVDGAENKQWNVMCRDVIFSSANATTANYEASSFSVLHSLDGALLNKAMFGFDGRFKRFADNGLLVDTMYVDGTGPEAIDGRNYYLVASKGNINIKDNYSKTPSDSMVVRKAGYVMRKLAEGDTDYSDVTREKLIVQQSQNVLVTNEGYQVKEVVNAKTKAVTYEYVHVVENGGVYKILCKSDGTELRKVWVADAPVETPEEGGDSSDEGSGSNN